MSKLFFILRNLCFIIHSNKQIKTSSMFTQFRFLNVLYWKQLRQFVKTRHPFLLLWTVPFLSPSPDVSKRNTVKTSLIHQKKEISEAIQKADELFDSNKFQEATSVLLPYRESGNVEVLWRLSRAQYNLSQLSTVSDADKQILIHEAYDAISDALILDNLHWAVHKWMSVLLDARATYHGIKARITQLEQVKTHMLRAAELNPKDATTLYMLGSWCYQIADMPWVQRKIAATIFAAPPTSSYEEALHFFLRAEEIQPRFYSQNLLMLGKTLLRLQREKDAIQYLSLARDYHSTNEEDDLVRKEAAEILKGLKTKEDQVNK